MTNQITHGGLRITFSEDIGAHVPRVQHRRVKQQCDAEVVDRVDRGTWLRIMNQGNSHARTTLLQVLRQEIP